MPEPQKFHIGLIDLFAVWLPGAMLTYALALSVGPCLAADGYLVEDSGVAAAALFLFASYLLGHFVFAIGALVLDPIYGAIRKDGDKAWRKAQGLAEEADDPRQESWKAARGTTPLNWILKGMRSAAQPLVRFVSLRLFDEHDFDGFEAARRIKGALPETSRQAMNCFQWSKARLALTHPQALAGVERFEGDSKFFRSLCVVLPLLVGWAIAGCDWVLAAAFAVTWLLSFWRFLELRKKAVSQAYWFVVTLKTLPAAEKGPPRPAEE
jgi:hypothetical protein